MSKFKWREIEFLICGMRLDEQLLSSVTGLEISRLAKVYKGKREQAFLRELRKSLEL